MTDYFHCVLAVDVTHVESNIPTTLPCSLSSGDAIVRTAFPRLAAGAHRVTARTANALLKIRDNYVLVIDEPKMS